MMETYLIESMITCRSPLRMHVQICVWSSLKNHSRTSISYTVKHIKNHEWNTVKHDKCNKQPLGISKNIPVGKSAFLDE